MEYEINRTLAINPVAYLGLSVRSSPRKGGDLLEYLKLVEDQFAAEGRINCEKNR